ncbi:hypothetical protein D3C86_1618920 [compost metagenome]
MHVVDHIRVLGEDRRLERRFDIGFHRHQAFLARLLQNFVEQRHQLEKALLVVFGGFERRGQRAQRGLDHLGLVGHDERPQRRPTNGEHFKGQGLRDDANIAAVQHVRAKDTGEGDDETKND